ncbi:MAG: GspMb/PilO family protein [Thermoanaerobaculia bacterium]
MSAWVANLRFWLPGALFLALMLALLAVFGLRFADEAKVARIRLERRTQELEAVRAKRLEAEGVVDRIRSSEEGLADFYGRRLSTERQSLTRIIAEIKELAGRAGIPPEALNYQRERLEGQDVSRRTVTFAVQGTYAQLRQLINFFELSDSFLVLDQVAISSNEIENAPLRINLTLSTLFTASAPAADVAVPGVPELES